MSLTLTPDTNREPARILAEPLTPEWYEQRRAGIGASEIAAILGLSPWQSAFGLYWAKVNGWEVEETEAMATGRHLEPTIAEWWYIRHASEVADMIPGHLLAHPDRPWELATPDRLVDFEESFEVAVLELKWVAQSWDGWGESGSDDVPIHYRCQVLWQCDVVGVDHWFIAALGPGGFREYLGRRDDKDIATMVEHGRRFMARIEAGDPPPLDDHHATVTTLKRLHPDLEDVEVEVDEKVAAGYLRAVAMKRKAEAVKDRYEAQLRAQMGSARKATHGGAFVASRSIYDVGESVRAAYTVDKLNPPREKKH